MKVWVVYETTYDHYQIMGIWYNEDEARASMKLCEEEKNKKYCKYDAGIRYDVKEYELSGKPS